MEIIYLFLIGLENRIVYEVAYCLT